ncbi:PLP-dependent transferase, partial [Aureobasidium melanogenum]
MQSATPTGVLKDSYTPTNSPQACPTLDSDWQAEASPLPPTPDSDTCQCEFESLSCVPKSSLSATQMSDLFGTVCGLSESACAGIQHNATTGKYGAYSMCNSTVQLAVALDTYYKQQSSQASACNFGGMAMIQNAGAKCSGSVAASSGPSGSASASRSSNAGSSLVVHHAFQANGAICYSYLLLVGISLSFLQDIKVVTTIVADMAIQDLIIPGASHLQLSPTLAINEAVESVQAQGRKVVHLGFGEATFPIQKDVLKIHEHYSRSTSYMPVAGLMSLRQSIAKFNSERLGVRIDTEQIIVAPGSKALLFALFDILQGDVLLPRPSWVSYEPQIKHANKSLFWVETDEEDRHTITKQALDDTYEKAIQNGGNPRIMLINSPSNPTGQTFTATNMEIIVRFCQTKQILLISDEIYSDIAFDGLSGMESPLKYAKVEDSSTSIIVTGGLSKTYSAGGWRVGYAILPRSTAGSKVMKVLIAYASECWSAASSPSQHAAVEAFSTGEHMTQYRESVRLLHTHCTTRLYESLRDLGLKVAKPSGAFYVYPSFQPYAKQLAKVGVRISAELSQWLIMQCGIAALPGSAFGEDDEGLEGGRLRLRMATSYLYFKDQEERYTKGHKLLEEAAIGRDLQLPMLDEAISALAAAVEKIKSI